MRPKPESFPYSDQVWAEVAKQRPGAADPRTRAAWHAAGFEPAPGESPIVVFDDVAGAVAHFYAAAQVRAMTPPAGDDETLARAGRLPETGAAAADGEPGEPDELDGLLDEHFGYAREAGQAAAGLEPKPESGSAGKTDGGAGEAKKKAARALAKMAEIGRHEGRPLLRSLPYSPSRDELAREINGLVAGRCASEMADIYDEMDGCGEGRPQGADGAARALLARLGAAYDLRFVCMAVKCDEAGGVPRAVRMRVWELADSARKAPRGKPEPWRRSLEEDLGMVSGRRAVRDEDVLWLVKTVAGFQAPARRRGRKGGPA